MSASLVRAPFLDPAADALHIATPAPRKALFLDRDGVININHGYVHTPEQTDWVPGIFELVAAAPVSYTHLDVYKRQVATKVSGAGGGGFMMFVCDPVDRLRLSAALSVQGGSLLDFHFNPGGATAWRTA